MSTDVERSVIYRAYCTCGWKGGIFADPADADDDADDHDEWGCDR